MTIHYAPESMRLSTSVLDIREYLPPARVYAPVGRNMSITTEAQSKHKCEAPRQAPWYMGKDGRVVEEDLLCFLKSTVRIKGEANLPTANPGTSPEHKGAFDDTDSAEPSYPTSALNEFHRKITNDKRVSIQASTPRRRVYSAHPRSSMITCTISRPCTLSATSRTKLRSTATISPIEGETSFSEFLVPHSPSNHDKYAIEKSAHIISKQRAETVCSALNLTATNLPRRSNIDLIKSKTAASELLTTVLTNSLTFSNEAKRRRSPRSATNKS